jgi:hypothetical protein
MCVNVGKRQEKKRPNRSSPPKVKEARLHLLERANGFTSNYTRLPDEKEYGGDENWPAASKKIQGAFPLGDRQRRAATPNVNDNQSGLARRGRRREE